MNELYINQLDETFDSDTTFSYENYEVIEVDTGLTIRKAAITFKKDYCYVNSTCLKEMPGTEYVQFLINSIDKKLIIRQCQNQTQNSVLWCSTGKKKTSKHISSYNFSKKIFEIMNWNLDCSYRCFGEKKTIDNQNILLFDLKSGNIFVPKKILKNNKDDK